MPFFMVLFNKDLITFILDLKILFFLLNFTKMMIILYLEKTFQYVYAY